MSLKDLRILVTGASSGIGAHIGTFLARQGAKVALAARRVETLERLAEDAGPGAHAVAMDVRDADSVAAATREAADRLGGLDGLFANAGVSWGGRALDMPEDEWVRIIDVNLNGVFRSARAAAPIIAESGGGAVLVTASVLSFRPGQGVAAYAASKAGVAHLVRSFALEWARLNIRVNAIAPGYIPTEMNAPFLHSEKGQRLADNVPMRRFGTPEELEGPVELLLGPKGSFITGAILPVDGGHLCQSV